MSDPFIKNENSVLTILIEKSFEQKITFVSWKWGLFFLKKGNSIFSIKLGQRLLESFSQFYVKNLTFCLSYFLKKTIWTKVYAGLRLPTLPYIFPLYLDDIVNQRHTKIPIEFYSLILENILEWSLWTILGEYKYRRRWCTDACTNESRIQFFLIFRIIQDNIFIEIFKSQGYFNTSLYSQTWHLLLAWSPTKVFSWHRQLSSYWFS